MKRYFFRAVLAAAIFIALCEESSAQGYWSKLADATADALIENFWGASFPDNPTRFYFNYESAQADLTNDHYWPQAHAMDVVTDALRRTGDAKYRIIYPLWWDGLPRFNPRDTPNPAEPWWNEYVDDMEWVCIAMLRMFETNPNADYIVKAKQVFNNWILPTWGPDDEAPWYGGITWKTSVKKSKNACSNGPAAIVAALIYNNYDKCGIPDSKPKEEYLKDAIRIYQWEKAVLFDSETGGVADNINGEGFVNKYVFSYNSGTFLGAAHLLHKATGDPQYLDDAIKAADYCIVNKGVGEPRHLVDPGTGDAGLFHGIFFRYFVQLILDENVPQDKREQYRKYLTETAEIAAASLTDGVWLFSPDWLGGKVGPGDKAFLNPHVSGATLMAAMALIE